MPILTDPDAAAFRAQVRQSAPDSALRESVLRESVLRESVLRESVLRETMQTVEGKLNTARLASSDEYMKAPQQAHIHSESGRQYFGSLSICGITAPGYPERATYCKSELFYRFDVKKEIYVYEAGYFWESSAWFAYFREHRKTRAEAKCS